MSPKSDGFRVHALTAEASARAATDPEVKRKFLDIAQSWLAVLPVSCGETVWDRAIALPLYRLLT
jgi:hypothetical protein